MKKLIIMILVIMLVIPSVSAATTYGSNQIVPDGHPNVTFVSLESKNNGYRMQIGFDALQPFSDGIVPDYHIEYVMINNVKIRPAWVGGAPEIGVDSSWGIKTNVLNFMEAWGWVDGTKIVYEIDFLDQLPQSINGQWYIQEIKFENKDFDIVVSDNIQYPLYRFEHNDLKRYPLITLNHGDVFRHETGYVFVEPGYTAVSTFDEENIVDLTSEVSIDYGGIVPGQAINTEDTYIIRYSVEDSMGNIGYTERLVIIGDAPPPELIDDAEDGDDETFTPSEGSSGGDSSEGTPIDMDKLVKDYWWGIVLVAFFIVFFFSGSFPKALAVGGIILVLLFTVYGKDLFSSDVLDMLKGYLPEASNG